MTWWWWLFTIIPFSSLHQPVLPSSTSVSVVQLLLDTCFDGEMWPCDHIEQTSCFYRGKRGRKTTSAEFLRSGQHSVSHTSAQPQADVTLRASSEEPAKVCAVKRLSRLWRAAR